MLSLDLPSSLRFAHTALAHTSPGMLLVCATGCEQTPTVPKTQPPSQAPTLAETKQSAQTQAQNQRQGKKKTWSMSYTGGIQGELKGESVILAPVANVMLTIGLQPSLQERDNVVLMTLRDIGSMKEPGFVSARNTIKLNLRQTKQSCVFTNTKITLNEYDKKTKTIAGSFEGEGLCVRGDRPKIALKGTFSIQ